MKFAKIFLSIMGFLSLIACSSQERAGIDPSPEHRANANIQNSFSIAQNISAQPLEDQYRVYIKREALGKEFLLSANLLSQTPTPQFAGLQSRVVSFIERGGKLILLDVTQTSAIGYDNIPQTLLLAEFSILAQTKEMYEIDFTSGLKAIFTGTDWTGSDDLDYSGPKYELPLVPVRLSYTDEARWQNNTLFIRQVAQLENRTEKRVEAIPVELRLQFKPYLPAQDFQPVLSPGFDRVGFFEATPVLLRNGSTRLYATKWNENKPIVFHLSANTPKEYRAVLTSGILYWNKILGENRIQVEQLEDSKTTAPQFDRNVIQWVDWDSAPYAYADASVDPRSGEITSAQVFIPSAFFASDVLARLRLLPNETKSTLFRVGLKGFSFSRLCQRDLAKVLRQRGLSANFKNIPEANLKKVIELYVWEVMAHELGHVMGLRHNFAGSLAANYDASERPGMIKKFYETLKVPEGLITTSTVMEYSLFDESAWNSSRLIRPEVPALTYDKMAMDYLYFKKPLPLLSRPAFCTDSQTLTYIDCSTGDAGKSIVSFATFSYGYALQSIAARLLNEYTAKSKVGERVGDRIQPVRDVSLETKKYVELVIAHFAKTISFLKADQKYIGIRSSFFPFRQNDEVIANEKEVEYLKAEFARAGGLETAVAVARSSLAQELVSEFDRLLQDPSFTQGKLRDGSPYLFSNEEKVIMLEQVKLFAPRFHQELIAAELKVLAGEDSDLESSYGQSKPVENFKWASGDLTEQLADLLKQRFLDVALGKTGKVLKVQVAAKEKEKGEGGQVNKTTQVELPIYNYPQSLRVLASKLFSNKHEDINWGYIQKIEQSEAIESELSILGDEEKIDKKSLSKEALTWYLYNKQLQSVIGGD